MKSIPTKLKWATPIVAVILLIAYGFHTMNPVIFKMGGFELRWYGLMMATGFLFAYSVLIWRARKVKFPLEQVSDVIITAVIGGIVGSRINYCISYWSEAFADRPWYEVFYVHKGGLVFLGGFIGATFTMIMVARWRKMSLLDICDFAALGLPIGHTFGRIGCFLNGCCFGRVHQGFPSITYPFERYGHIYRKQLSDGLITQNDICQPVYPVQLFSAGANFSIFLIVLLISRFVKKKGQLFAVYLMLYPIGRMINETFRGDYTVSHYTIGLTPAQVLVLIIFPIGMGFFFWTRAKAPEIDFADSAKDKPEEPNA